MIAPERAIGCVVYCATELEAPGVIRHIEGTRFSIGEPDGTISERCTRFSEAMVAGGLKSPVEPDIRNDIWVKLMGNVAFNPLSALTRATMVRIATHPPSRALVAAIMAETVAIARAVGCEPAVEIERRLNGAERVGEHKTSTLMDLEAGKPLELGAIVDAVVELADLTGTPAPHLKSVWAATGAARADPRTGGAAMNRAVPNTPDPAQVPAPSDTLAFHRALPGYEATPLVRVARAGRRARARRRVREGRVEPLRPAGVQVPRRQLGDRAAARRLERPR